APEGAGALPLVSPLSHGAAGKYDARPPWGLAAYGLVQFFLVIAATLLLLFREGELASWQRVGLALWILWTCTNLGGLFDRRAWVLPGEMARLAAGPVFATAWLAGSRSELVAWVILAGMLSFGAAGAWLLSYRAALDRRGSARAARLESTAGG
ncbi:MAG TPA: hypothetical protein PK413_22365, partial [Thermoanaerobaculia bacterium]|nr:hypothetical protein [Thermoanaerobaculia bacterium]